MLDQFVVFAFVWAYSLRAQYYNVGWLSAQNYIIGSNDVINSLNIYKYITEADSPITLLGVLSDRISPLPISAIVAKREKIDEQNDSEVFLNYLHHFKANNFMEDENE
jgi:hypothetical protein